MKTGIVILAAGESARMGEPKQLLGFDGSTLLKRTMDTALALTDVRIAVVLGAHAVQIRGQLDETRVLVVENPDWQNGMGGSIRTGLGALLAEDPELPAVVFLTCDQPLLTSAVIGHFISTHEQSGSPLVASEYDNTLGVPALFGRPLFPELLALDGASGARRIILNHRDQAVGIPFPGGAVDIDTPDDYRQLRETRGNLPTLTNV